MFANKESLYLNIIKYDTQLKLDYKKLNNDVLEKNDNAVFLVDDEILSNDIAHKINLYQKEILNTNISSILISDSTKLIKKDNKNKIDDCTIAEFNSEYNIVVLNTTLFETKHYFNKTGIDFIYSAFHILNLHLEQNICKNEFLCLTFNNKAYILIINNESSIVYSNTIDLPSFEEIKKSEFYEDEVLGQKLFDELFYLEFNTLIQKELNSFYEKTSDIFIEKITILYSSKQFSKDDIRTLSSEILLDIAYHPINMEEEMFELSQDKHQKKSFIKPRKKPKSNTLNIVIFIFLLLSFASYFTYDMYSKQSLIKEKPILIKEKIVNTSNISLPDHINFNDRIEKRIKAIFSIIPYDVLLKEITLSENSLFLKGEFLRKDSFLKSMKSELENLYEEVSISYEDKEKKNLLKGEVSSLKVKSLENIKYKTNKLKYMNDEYFPVSRVSEQLKILMPEDTILKFKTTSNAKISSFKYLVNTVVKSPEDFFGVINSLNNELYSIQVLYPIKMTKVEFGLEIEFYLSFNQQMN